MWTITNTDSCTTRRMTTTVSATTLPPKGAPPLAAAAPIRWREAGQIWSQSGKRAPRQGRTSPGPQPMAAANPRPLILGKFLCRRTSGKLLPAKGASFIYDDLYRVTYVVFLSVLVYIGIRWVVSQNYDFVIHGIIKVGMVKWEMFKTRYLYKILKE